MATLPTADISTFTLRCLAALKTFATEQQPQQGNAARNARSMHDELGRFKIWAGNLSAHAPSGRRSLEYRLRDSQNLRAKVIDILSELQIVLDRG